MGRTQVHFATGPSIDEILPEGRHGPAVKMDDRAKQPVISGMRSDAQILIYIDLKKALAAGCPFYRSENGVILSEGIELTGKENEDKTNETKQKVIPLEFFDVVVERKAGLGILWEKGQVVQELPAELAGKKNPKARVDSRKSGRGGKR
jgi:2'-phosphotransferase